MHHKISRGFGKDFPIGVYSLYIRRESRNALLKYRARVVKHKMFNIQGYNHEDKPIFDTSNNLLLYITADNPS